MCFVKTVTLLGKQLQPKDPLEKLFFLAEGSKVQ